MGTHKQIKAMQTNTQNTNLAKYKKYIKNIKRNVRIRTLAVTQSGKTSVKKFLPSDPDPYPDYHRILVIFFLWLMCHISAEFCENRFGSFFA